MSNDSAAPVLESEPANAKQQRLNLVAAIGLGLLIGLLVALSRSPIVRDVTLGLVALLATFLGLNTSRGRGHPLRLSGFSFGCMVALLAGIGIRNHDLLSPAHALSRLSPAELQEIFGADDGRRLWVISQLGEIPAGVMGRSYATGTPEPAPTKPSDASKSAPDSDGKPPPPSTEPRLGSALVGKEGSAAASCGALVAHLKERSLTFDEMKHEYALRDELRAIPPIVETLGVRAPADTLSALGKLVCDLAGRAGAAHP